MNEEFLRATLTRPGDDAAPETGRETLARLRPETMRAAARLKRQRQARRQNLLFAACGLGFCAVALAFFEAQSAPLETLGALKTGAALAARTAGRSAVLNVPGAALKVGAGLMALILLLAPVMAYYLEKEREHEKA